MVVYNNIILKYFKDEIRNKLLNNVFNIDELIDISDKIILYIGENDRKLMNINLTMNRKYSPFIIY